MFQSLTQIYFNSSIQKKKSSMETFFTDCLFYVPVELNWPSYAAQTFSNQHGVRASLANMKSQSFIIIALKQCSHVKEREVIPNITELKLSAIEKVIMNYCQQTRRVVAHSMSYCNYSAPFAELSESQDFSATFTRLCRRRAHGRHGYIQRLV